MPCVVRKGRRTPSSAGFTRQISWQKRRALLKRMPSGALCRFCPHCFRLKPRGRLLGRRPNGASARVQDPAAPFSRPARRPMIKPSRPRSRAGVPDTHVFSGPPVICRSGPRKSWRGRRPWVSFGLEAGRDPLEPGCTGAFQLKLSPDRGTPGTGKGPPDSLSRRQGCLASSPPSDHTSDSRGPGPPSLCRRRFAQPPAVAMRNRFIWRQWSCACFE